MENLDIFILRSYFNDCTLGRLRTNTGFQCFSLELPWLGNKRKISCIPEGRYDAYIRFSPNQGRKVITLRDVEDRTWINIEVGNYTRNILGCAIVGDGIRDIDNDGIPDVTNSLATFNKLMEVAEKADKISVIISAATKPGGSVYI